MKYLIPVIILFLFNPLKLSSTETTIHGTIEIKDDYETDYIRLLHYKDFISKELETLSWSMVKGNGEFTITLDIDQTEYCLLDYDFINLELYIEPGETYILKILEDSVKHLPLSAGRPSLNVILLSPENGINQKISDFNRSFENFLMENIRSSYGKLNKKAVFEFKKNFKEKAEQQKDDYYKEYIRYKIATLELLSRSNSKGMLAQLYIENNPILYNNVEYMDFFNSLFSEFLISNRSLITNQNLKAIIKESESYNSVLELLKKINYLQDDQLRELVLIKNLKQLYYSPGYEQSKILKFLTQLSKESEFIQNKFIASNIINKINKLSVGFVAPPFNLLNTENQKISLESLQGKPVYLIFFQPNDIGDIAELEFLKEVFNQFSEKIHFISIATSGNPIQNKLIKKERSYNWLILSLESNIELLGNYNIINPPDFLIIDSSGKILKDPAPSPSEDLAGYLSTIVKE